MSCCSFDKIKDALAEGVVHQSSKPPSKIDRVPSEIPEKGRQTGPKSGQISKGIKYRIDIVDDPFAQESSIKAEIPELTPKASEQVARNSNAAGSTWFDKNSCMDQDNSQKNEEVKSHKEKRHSVQIKKSNSLQKNSEDILLTPSSKRPLEQKYCGQSLRNNLEINNNSIRNLSFAGNLQPENQPSLSFAADHPSALLFEQEKPSFSVLNGLSQNWSAETPIFGCKVLSNNSIPLKFILKEEEAPNPE